MEYKHGQNIEKRVIFNVNYTVNVKIPLASGGEWTPARTSFFG